MNTILFDIKDSVRYRSLPKLRMQYSVPMRELRELAALARRLGLTVVPKLNFSRSNRFRHSHWIWPEQRKPDTRETWRQAFSAIDEVIAATKSEFFHVGMDEDDTRSPDEYMKALLKLSSGLKTRGQRMVMWADCGHNWRESEQWKVAPAIDALPRNVILMLWSYNHALDKWVQHYKRKGFDVVGASGALIRLNQGSDLSNIKAWDACVRKHKAAGHIMTTWSKCSKVNRKILLGGIRRSGAVMSK
ncbi:MAG: hypothetical protein KAH23_03125 [Kiritimatiellae bacterium]|nr:hypothetical protein [Kiritimatiellia bacterium]